MLQRARLVGEWSEVLLKPTIGDLWFIAGPAGGLLTVYMTLSLRDERTVEAKVGSREKRGCIKVVGSRSDHQRSDVYPNPNPFAN